MTTPANPTPEPDGKDCECCTCGHRWHSSEDGTHNCVTMLQNQLAIARRRLAEAQEGEKWAGNMFCEIMATAVSGLADAVIVAQRKMNAGHTLKAVQMLRDHANDQKAKLTALRNAADGLSASLEEHQMFVVMWAESWRSNPAYGNNQPEIHPTHAGIIERAKQSRATYSALIAEGVGK